MRSTVRTARKAHRCGCGNRIQPGNRYTEHVCSPGYEFGSGSWDRLAECAECAARYGRPVGDDPRNAAAVGAAS